MLCLHLRACIVSRSRSLHLCALKILSSKLVKSTPGERDVLNRCLQGEGVSLDAQGVRERVLRIGRIGQMIKGGEPLATDLCPSSRSIYDPYGRRLPRRSCPWPSDSGTADKTHGLPERLNENIGQDVNGDRREEQRTWRDGAAHRLRTMISNWLDQDHDRRAIVFCASLAEKRNRELVPFFLSLAVNDDNVSNLARYKLHAWLALLSKSTNPKALHATETLFIVYRAFLSHPDRTLQTVALSCVLTYKPPYLMRHEETFQRFLDDTLWRGELAHLDFSSLDTTDRPMFVDATARLLFGTCSRKRDAPGEG
ncbi:down-regulated in metastasis-domain-containing protein [Boletus reticuloceps]|uniref:Down-regulated in metastasis-domain-containing protein n=1 Tax=Boletus reticuloceps TaxID=495285 RepID=A0A8I2YEF0_9AGAM|nr:down-regulated in metastasis-domain-containing protein [Boletus reticuloceps]